MKKNNEGDADDVDDNVDAVAQTMRAWEKEAEENTKLFSPNLGKKAPDSF